MGGSYPEVEIRTVAILGNASRTRGLAPFDDPTIPLWAMTIHAYKARRVSAVLEMHDDVMDGDRWGKYQDTPLYRQWLKDAQVPVYMHRPHPLIPSSITYPRSEIENLYGKHLLKGDDEISMFGGTASFGIALALLQGFERIELYGIELSPRPEYYIERDCVFLWIGKATILGVDVYIPENSRLYSKVLYP